MSVWIYLEQLEVVQTTGIFCRNEGDVIEELSWDEFRRAHPNLTPLTYCSKVVMRQVYERNLTSNLGGMADALGIYDILYKQKSFWNGDRVQAKDLYARLMNALTQLDTKPDAYLRYEPANKWGTVESMKDALASLIAHCSEFPDAYISVS